MYMVSNGKSDDFKTIRVIVPDCVDDEWIDDHLEELQKNVEDADRRYNAERYINQAKGAIQSATLEDLIKTSNVLRADLKLRQRVEKEMRDSLPEGCDFYIDELGIGIFKFPLFVSSNIKELG